MQVACVGCSLASIRRFEDQVRTRRLALLGSYPAWLGKGESRAEHAFRLARLVLCSSNRAGTGKKVRRVEQKAVGKGTKGKKVVIVEEWERGWMYLKAVRLPSSRV